MSKKIIGLIKLQIPASKANPSPPVGPALGQKGLNIMEFCKAFNTLTQDMESGIPIPVIITAYSDRSFTFKIKTVPTSYLLLKSVNIKKGSSLTGRDFVGEISMDKLREIAKKKIVDLNTHDIDVASSMIAGSAKSMGLKVVGS